MKRIADTEGLAKRLRARREALGMTQEEVARAAGTDQTQYQKVEAGLTKHPRNLEQIAAAVQVSPAWLLYGVEEVDQLTREGIALALAWQDLPDDDKKAIQTLIRKLK